MIRHLITNHVGLATTVGFIELRARSETRSAARTNETVSVLKHNSTVVASLILPFTDPANLSPVLRSSCSPSPSLSTTLRLALGGRAKMTSREEGVGIGV